MFWRLSTLWDAQKLQIEQLGGYSQARYGDQRSNARNGTAVLQLPLGWEVKRPREGLVRVGMQSTRTGQSIVEARSVFGAGSMYGAR